MVSIALINPNSSAATLERMLAVARPLLPPGFELIGVRAERGPSMIVDEAGLQAAAEEVLRLGTELAQRCDGVIVAAFGGPGVERLCSLVGCPVLGIGDAAIRSAAARGRFAVATTTPRLVAAIERQVAAFAAPDQFLGVRLAEGDPLQLAADPALQLERLREAMQNCFERDGADAVVIGGGPLADSARALHQRYGERVVEPVPVAMHMMLDALRERLATPGSLVSTNLLSP